MNHTVELNELAGALSKAQASMGNAKKDASNPFFKSKYADLASVWDAIRGPITAHGLAVIQSVGCDEEGMFLVTKLIHSSGQWVDSQVRIKPVKDDPQGLGSAITYVRRYALQAIVGVAPEDDDGNAASGMSEPKAIKQPQRTSAPKSDQSAVLKPTQAAIINQAQVVRFYSIVRKAGYNDSQIKEVLTSCGYSSSKDISEKHYQTIIDTMENNPVEQLPLTIDQLVAWIKESNNAVA
jgi:hypothetical protein